MNKERVGLFLQARLGSSRLPKKILLPLGGKSLIEQAMESLKNVVADSYVLLTDNDSFSRLELIANKSGFTPLAGPSEDVLRRFAIGLECFPVDIVIRATGDNPLVSSEAATYALEMFKKRNADYLALEGLPLGAGVEIVRAKALLQADREATSSYDREHVCPYLYNNPSKFKIVRLKCLAKWRGEGKSITIDTDTEYENVVKLYSMLYKGHPIELEEIVKALPPAPKILIYPSIAQGNGTGHLIRTLRIAAHLDGVAFYSDDTKRFLSLVQSSGHETPWFINHSQLTSLKLIFVDAKSIDRLPKDIASLSIPIIALDEGGALRSYADYLIDSLPNLINSSPNRRVMPLFDLPAKVQNGAKKIASSSKGKGKEPQVIEVSTQKHFDMLVSFGGEDPKDLTSLFLKQWMSKKIYSYKIGVVLGPGYKGALVQEKDRYSHLLIDWIISPLSLEPYIQNSDIIITSFGLTAYESMRKDKEIYLLEPTLYHHKLAQIDGFSSFPSMKVSKLIELLQKRNRSNDTKIVKKEIPIERQESDVVKIIQEFVPSQITACPLCCSKERVAIHRTQTRSFFKCKKCHTIYQQLYEEFTDRYNQDYFFSEYEAQYGKSYIDDFEPIFQNSLRRCKQIARYLSNKKSLQIPSLLDVGAAYGHFLAATRVFGWNSTGIEISLSAVDYMLEKGHNAICCDFQTYENLTEDFDGYDIISAWFVLEHLATLSTAIDKIISLLKPKAVFAFAVPNYRGISSLKNYKKFLEDSPKDHHTIFTPLYIKRFLKKRGFKKIKIVVTGHHPQRIIKHKANPFLDFLLLQFSKIFRLGDTFECYAQWGGRG